MAYAFDDFMLLVGELKRGSAADEAAVRRYACALVAALAYRHVPRAEVDRSRRAQVIPCADYRRIVATGMPTTVAEEYLRGLDGVGLFTVEERGVVAVGVLVDRILFVGFRGTQYLYDWKVNFRAAVERGFGGRIHRGFLEETVRVIPPLLDKIHEECRRQSGEARLDVVHFAGHSLGGAIAAIAAWLVPLRVDFLRTFGAPRYADASAGLRTWVCLWEGPPRPVEHVQARGDTVPFVPPRWMGYADNPNNVTTAGKRVGFARGRSTWLHTAGQAGLFFARLAGPHSMQRYRLETGCRTDAPNFAAPLIPDTWAP